MSENEQNRPDSYFVSQQEPEAKPPPVLETGILKWLRDNLFNSTLNAVLTVLGIALVIYTINGLWTWIVQDANWFMVSVNIRNLMLGRYEQEFEWRANLTLYISVFAIGAAIAVWIRQSARTFLISIVVIILSVQVFPRLINATMDLPMWYAGAGNSEITIGQTTAVADPLVSFIAQEGEEITISLASEINDGEEGLANINGFVDSISNTLRNLADNRLDEIDRIAEIQEQVTAEDEARTSGGIPVITTSQYDEYASEVDGSEISDPTIETYRINQIPVMVEILDPETLQPIASQLLTTYDDVLQLTVPASGWYILTKELVTEGVEVDVAEGFAVLSIQGIYPLSKRETAQFVEFTRRPDNFNIEIRQPRIDDEPVPFIDIIRNQYRGERPLNDYLRTYVSTFLLDISNYITIVFLIGIAGYVFTEILRNSAGMEVASKFATYALMSIPVVVWVLINGMYLYSFMMWLLFVSMCLFSYLLFKLVKANGYSQNYLIAGIALYVVAVVVLVLSATNTSTLATRFDFPRLLTVLPLVIDDAAVPRFMVWLGIIIIPFSIYTGRAAYIPGEQVKVNLPLYAGLGIIFFLISAVALIVPMDLGFVTLPITIDTEWLLQPSDARNWGGLLLTMVLTLYGIIIAFPIGVGLALGRRSDLPLIKYLCTAYIELVRGSPFITVLFFMQLFIPLINSDFNQVPGSYRAIAATIAFSAAYLAENVRGGLQSLPPGQAEAAKALGLNPWQAVSLITMPQALRAVIPALVGQFISLFKDTSLVTIVGLLDLVGFVNSIVVQAEFIGTRLEGLLFISILYFVFSYVMSYVSRLLEASGSGGTRRM